MLPLLVFFHLLPGRVAIAHARIFAEQIWLLAFCNYMVIVISGTTRILAEHILLVACRLSGTMRILAEQILLIPVC